MDSTPKPESLGWSCGHRRYRAMRFLSVLWAFIVGNSLLEYLKFPPGTPAWVEIAVPGVYGAGAGIFYLLIIRWARSWAPRWAPSLDARTLERGRLPGFVSLSFVALLGPMVAFMPVALYLHLRTTAVYMCVGFGAMVLMQAYSLATEGIVGLLVQAREEALRAKLAPHFIFNTLNTLHAQIEHDPRGAQATTERLASLFRQVIASAERPTVPLREELAFVEAYLAIEQARLGNRLRVRVEVPEELEGRGVPPLSLQVLAENAVKHGVAPLERGGEVVVGARAEGAGLRVWVDDPGTGFSERRGTGTALDTLRRRLARPEDLVMERTPLGFRVGFLWRQA